MKLPAHVLFRKELSLMVWKPHGVLDQALVNEIVAFVEGAEERAQKPFNTALSENIAYRRRVGISDKRQYNRW